MFWIGDCTPLGAADGPAAGQLESIEIDGRFIVRIGSKSVTQKTLELSRCGLESILPSVCAFWQLD